jgi:protoporphyrin/coproporphyrin ferrochelatase
VSCPFDAVLLIAFGGPQGPGDIRPFLENVLRGRRVAPGRIDEVAHHYELFNGVSPLTDLTMRQADGLRQILRDSVVPLPVYVGMRNWHPLLADTLAAMSRDGVRHAVGIIAAAHRSYSSCTQYRENVADARRGLVAAGLSDVKVSYVQDWHDHPLFVAANAEHVVDAMDRLPEAFRPNARLIFTAHSIPLSMAERYPYREQFEETARRVAAEVARLAPAAAPRLPHACVYQSRSGRPEDPWLEPDVCDYLRAQKAEGLAAAVLAPIGFVCDHVEVLYDLDVEAADVCREIALPMVRAQAVNDSPRFVEMLADVTRQTCRRYEHGTPLEVVAS